MHQLDSWTVTGILLGYPSCCVRAFSTGSVFEMAHYKNGPFTLQGTGFVPCDKCNDRSPESLITEINQHRLVNYKFPNQTKEFIKQHNLIGYDVEDEENREQAEEKLIASILQSGLPDRYKELSDIIYD
ncbi:hypothetical protein [Aeromonas phage ZPAH34]|uniref:hypothetical protein n=1 Tax=Aeromonas phage ZPAH34 TaxID=2924888 RepID=UPI0023299EDA|nr:hypothetical protein PQD16_gp146 [Aeromonas phage ZPAH34]UOX39537.1 hypothetical protein [Aeromonas phage ZPAH34]